MNTLVKSALSLAFGFALASSAHASNWVGTGEAFDLQGNKVADYSLDVAVTDLGAGKSLSIVTVTLADGSVRKYVSEDQHYGAQWSTSGDLGTGGGSCFGAQYDLCQSYTEKNGTAHASTIVFDSATEMRILRTELVKDNPTRFFRESLSKR